MIDHHDVPLLKELIRVSVDASNAGLSPHITGGAVNLAWAGFGPITVLPDGNDPNAADQGLISVQPLVGCDNWLPVGTRVLILHLSSGSFVIGRPNGSSDTWHRFNDINNGPIGNGWADASIGNQQRPGYRRCGSMVVLAGVLQRTSHSAGDSTLAILPADYAPSATYRWFVRCGPVASTVGGIAVNPAGQLVYEFGPMGVDGYDPSGEGVCELDCLTFPLG